jgi:rRNA pseudouridine-1189 N-methylase Emg1 (Nep1/Mra1 family)
MSPKEIAEGKKVQDNVKYLHENLIIKVTVEENGNAHVEATLPDPDIVHSVLLTALQSVYLSSRGALSLPFANSSDDPKL